MRKRLFSGWISTTVARAARARGAAAASLAAFSLLGVATLAQAEESAAKTNNFEITPFVGYASGGEFEDPTDGSDRDLDEDTSFGLIVNAAVDSWRHYEFLYSQQSTQLDGATPTDMDVQYLQIGGIVSNPDATRVIPYFGLTVGAARFSPDEAGLDDETKIAFSAAGGVRVPVTEHFAVRLDLRAFFTVLDSEGDLFCSSSSGLTCRVRAKSDSLLQYAASLGVTVGF